MINLWIGRLRTLDLRVPADMTLSGEIRARSTDHTTITVC